MGACSCSRCAGMFLRLYCYKEYYMHIPTPYSVTHNHTPFPLNPALSNLRSPLRGCFTLGRLGGEHEKLA